MKNVFLIVCLVILSLPCTTFSEERPYQDLQNIVERIQISNFINAISLSQEQLEFILEKAQEARNIRRSTEKEVKAYYEDFFEAYSMLEEEVEEGRVVVTKGTTKDFHRSKEKIDDIKYRLEKNLMILALDIKNYLGEHQIYAVNGFTPCLIPQLQDGRVGQAGSSKPIADLLDKVRTLPESVYAKRKPFILDRFMLRIEKMLPFLSQDELESYRKKLDGTLDRIRSMDDVDFSVQKEDIIRDLKASLKLRPHKEQSPEEKIKRFLLSEQSIEVLKKKMG